MKKYRKKLYIIYGSIITVLIATLIAEMLIEVHPLFGFDGKMFFHAWFGFVACIFMVLFSKILGLFVKRSEGYYKESNNE